MGTVRLLILLLCASCAAPIVREPEATPGELGAVLWVDPAFTDIEEWYINSAVMDSVWATGGSALFRFGALNELPWRIERGTLPVKLGAMMPLERRIVLDVESIDPPPTPTSEELKKVALHELWHVLLGPEHVPGTLMDQHIGDCIDWTTLDRFCEPRGGCAEEKTTCK